jgi:hypothetical protein
MIVGDNLGEHRHCDLAGPFPADVQTSRNMEAAKLSIVIAARQLGVGGSGTWLAAHHRDITSLAVEQQRQDRVTVGCVMITQHYRVCSGSPAERRSSRAAASKGNDARRPTTAARSSSARAIGLSVTTSIRPYAGRPSDHG